MLMLKAVTFQKTRVSYSFGRALSLAKSACLVPLMLSVPIVFAAVCSAQNEQAVHNHVSAPMIDGAVHPDQIPDVVAYRLVLLGLSTPPNPTDIQTKHHLARIREIGLSSDDGAVLDSALARFNLDYHDMIAAYNENATALNARGQRADINSFLLKRDQFIRSTHDQLKSVLSAEGWGRLDAYVQSNKRHMKISVAEASR